MPDVPADFEAQRTPYYQALKLPLDADRFIADLQLEIGASDPRHRRAAQPPCPHRPEAGKGKPSNRQKAKAIVLWPWESTY